MTARLHNPAAKMLLALTLVASLAACSKDEKSATQAAARVNDDEISVHQINFVLQRSNVKPDQAKAASEQILTRLVDQELAVQKALEKKLDRKPEVVQQLEAVKREVLERAYLESLAASVAKPTELEIKEYYTANPALFSERRVYTYRVLGIQAPVEKQAAIREQLQRSKSLQEVAEWAKGQNLRMVADGGTKPAEQLPMQSLPRLSKMKDGEVTANAGQGGVEILQLVQSRSEPANEEQAKPAIERYLSTVRRNDFVQKEMKALRAAAKIEFKGEFAHLAPGMQSAPVASPDSASAPLAPAQASAPAEASGPDAAFVKGVAAGMK